MTRDVATVRPDTPLKDVARDLVDYGISGMPVVDDDGGVVGVISEADVLAKERGESARSGGALARLLRRETHDELKLDARLASEAMTLPIATSSPERPANERIAARASLLAAVTSCDL